MMQRLRFVWHRFWEWRHQQLAERLYDRGSQHHDLAIEHGTEADRIDAARESRHG